MKNVILILFSLVTTLRIAASDKVRGHVFDEKKQPIIGANIYWEESKKGTVSDSNGYFEIDKSGQHEHLVVAYTGYVPQYIHIEESNAEVEIILKEDSQLLEEVMISKRTPGTVTKRSSILQTQQITMGEIRRDACCNLGESFTTNPSVDVAYSDAATGAKQIKLLGLAGTYGADAHRKLSEFPWSIVLFWHGLHTRSMDGKDLYL
jgi:hypothetical protein